MRLGNPATSSKVKWPRDIRWMPRSIQTICGSSRGIQESPPNRMATGVSRPMVEDASALAAREG
jgi:hypothetical protein